MSSGKEYNSIFLSKLATMKEERDMFDSMAPTIVEAITEPYKDIPELHSYYENMLNTNIPYHKQVTGIATVTAFKAFASRYDITPDNIYKANILAWGADLLWFAWQISDDIMDEAETRDGFPCWYKHEDIELRAINDIMFIQETPYVLLKKYFSQHEFYLSALQIFHEMNIKVILGQTLDTGSLVKGRPRLNDFDMERFQLMTKLKGGYAFMLPIALGMKFAKRNDPKLYDHVRSIMIKIGEYIVCQNDMLDCYANPQVIGKSGHDIQSGKCTWLIVKALEKATPGQRSTLERCYGKKSIENEEAVKTIYEDLGIYEEFLRYEEESLNQLRTLARQIPDELPRKYFLYFLQDLHGRNICT